MAETLGSLIDKLITTDLKLWHVQDKVHHASERKAPLDGETVRKLDDLNRQRNALMTELDQFFSDGLTSGKTVVDQRFKF